MSARTALLGRPFVLTTVGVLLVGSILGGGWFAANAFVSPTQREAAAAPPNPGPVTALIEQGALQRTITAEVIVEQAQLDVVALHGGDGVVTASPLQLGGRVEAGSVV